MNRKKLRKFNEEQKIRNEKRAKIRRQNENYRSAFLLDQQTDLYEVLNGLVKGKKGAK